MYVLVSQRFTIQQEGRTHNHMKCSEIILKHVRSFVI